jgi:hypothetical protein
VLHNLLLFASAWSKATFWRLVVSIHSPLELLFARWLRWLLAGFFLALTISTPPPAHAQDAPLYFMRFRYKLPSTCRTMASMSSGACKNAAISSATAFGSRSTR